MPTPTQQGRNSAYSSDASGGACVVAHEAADDETSGLADLEASMYSLHVQPEDVTFVAVAGDEKTLSRTADNNQLLRQELEVALGFVQKTGLEHRGFWTRFFSRLNPFGQDGLDREALDYKRYDDFYAGPGCGIQGAVTASSMCACSLITHLLWGSVTPGVVVGFLYGMLGYPVFRYTKVGAFLSLPALIPLQLPVAAALHLGDAGKTLRRLYDHFSDTPSSRSRNAVERIRRKKILEPAQREKLRATLLASLRKELATLNQADKAVTQSLGQARQREAEELLAMQKARDASPESIARRQKAADEYSAMQRDLVQTGRQVVPVAAESLDEALPRSRTETLSAMTRFLRENRASICDGSLSSVPVDRFDLLGLNRPLAAISRAPETLRPKLLDRLVSDIAATEDAMIEIASLGNSF